MNATEALELSKEELAKKEAEIQNAITTNKLKVDIIRNSALRQVEATQNFFKELQKIDIEYKIVLNAPKEKFCATIYEYADDMPYRNSTTRIVDTLEVEVPVAHITHKDATENIFVRERSSSNSWKPNARSKGYWMVLQHGWKKQYYKNANTIDEKIKEGIASIRFRNEEQIRHEKNLELAEKYASEKYPNAIVEVVYGTYSYVSVTFENGLILKVQSNTDYNNEVSFYEQVSNISKLDQTEYIKALINIPKAK